MSFTPRGGDGCKTGVVDCRFPPLPECCVNNERKCAAKTTFVKVEHPPWFHCPPKCPPFKKPLKKRAEYSYMLNYDALHEFYQDPKLESRVKPTMAFWFYCDHVPDPSGVSDGTAQHKRQTEGFDTRSIGPWPPLPQGQCPPPIECSPCGPGPYANPNLRRFFYMDCQ